jgi:hypothetical protein
MHTNSKEAPLSDNVSKQLTYDDDGNEDAPYQLSVGCRVFELVQITRSAGMRFGGIAF